MQKITSYKTTDGTVFTDKLAASQHQAALDLKAVIKAEHAPIFAASADAGRLLPAMVADPLFWINALKAYAKAARIKEPLAA